MNGVLTVLGSVPRGGGLRRGSALWRHLTTWLRDVADSLAEQQRTSFDEILDRTVSSWLHDATDCCHGEVLLWFFRCQMWQ